MLIFRFVPMGGKRILETFNENRENKINPKPYTDEGGILLRMITISFGKKNKALLTIQC